MQKSVIAVPNKRRAVHILKGSDSNRLAVPRTKNLRVLVLPDLHLRPACNGEPSGEDVQSLAAVERYVKDYKWDEVVQLGDLMSWDCISSHNLKNLRAVEGRTIQKEYD